jgi:hypothetical protein
LIMGDKRIAGGTVYRSPAFKRFWDGFYDSVENMRRSIEILRGSSAIDLPTLEYGRFQPILAPLDKDWPVGGLRLYMKEMGTARLNLTDQPNDVALSEDEPDVTPLTKCALLDAALRKCFNSEPPIPMDVYVEEQDENSPNRDTHTIRLVSVPKRSFWRRLRAFFNVACEA